MKAEEQIPRFARDDDYRGAPLCLLLMAALLVGCGDRLAAPSVGPPAPASIAELVADGVPPKPGGVVTFTARLSEAAASRKAGAYAARVLYDSTLVSYVGEGEATSGLVAFNAVGGVLKVAGASLDGYAGGVLFNAKFRVSRPTAGAELTLVIDELRDANASDRLPPQTASRTALLRPWK